MYRNSGKGVGSLSDLIRVALMYVHLLLPLAYNNEVNETVVQMYKGRGKLALLCKKVSPVWLYLEKENTIDVSIYRYIWVH